MFRCKLLLAAGVILVGLTMSGSGGSAAGLPAASGTPSYPPHLTIAYAGVGEGSAHWLALKANMEKDAAALGWKLLYYNNNISAETALSNARLIAAQKPDVVLEWNSVQSANVAIDAVFKRAGIPCVSINTPGASNCAYFNLNNPLICPYVARIVAQEARKHGWTGSNTDVIIVNAALYGTLVNACAGIFYYNLQKLMPGLARISGPVIGVSVTRIGNTTFQVNGNVEIASSYSAVSNVLPAIPKSKHIILFDIDSDSNIGSWRAIVKAGRQSDTITAVTGGFAAGLGQLRTNPSWIAEGAFFLPQWSYYTLAMAAAIKEGLRLPKQTTSASAVLTKNTTIPGTIVTAERNLFPGNSVTPLYLPAMNPVVNGIGNAYLAQTGILQKLGQATGLRVKGLK